MEHFEKLLTGLMYNQFITIRIDGLRGVSTYTLCFSNGKSDRVSKNLYSETKVGETFYLISCKNVVLNEFKATQYKL